jgi:hypothetical protein
LIASQENNTWQYVTVYHVKMVFGPKHVVAVTTEEEKGDSCVDGIIVKLIA